MKAQRGWKGLAVVIYAVVIAREKLRCAVRVCGREGVDAGGMHGGVAA